MMGIKEIHEINQFLSILKTNCFKKKLTSKTFVDKNKQT